jgi:tetratricopeptide (TPR) repeat protein
MRWDAERALEVWEAELRHRRGEDFRLEAALGVASCLSALGRYEEALARLDGFAPRKPTPYLLAHWLNNRGYLLTMVGRADEALRGLEEAALVVDTTTPAGQSLAGCISGTRGIALLHRGDLREGEELLLRALAIGKEAAAAEGRRDGPIALQEEGLAVQRWYWLGECAKRLGDEQEARRRFELAAAGDGPFAERARSRL